MSIPKQHQNRCLYHFSHIDNLPGLLTHGLLANTHPNFPKTHKSVAASGIQQRRAQMAVPCGPGGVVHDYVPLYFGSLSPMLLAVIHKKNVDQQDMLYFEFPIAILNRPDVVFTDSAANKGKQPEFFEDPSDLGKLDWDEIDSRKWGKCDDHARNRRMAEVLVHQNLPVSQAARCVVWDEAVKKRVQAIVGARPFPPVTFEAFERPHYYTQFFDGKPDVTLVHGPNEIAMMFESACTEVKATYAKQKWQATFQDLAALRDGLRANFGCLPHTAELVGLRSENGIHKKTVDLHTADVVGKLHSLPAFAKLDAGAQLLVEVAAWLHDIGKGPRSRWANNGGLQKVDPNHPVGAMPMMVEILTRHVAPIDPADARTLMKLVCYHDLVGDVLGKGRDEQQIIDVVESRRELDMLFALGEADATVLVEAWWDGFKAFALHTRCRNAI